MAVVPGVEVVSYASKPSTREIKAEGSESEDYPVCHGEIVAKPGLHETRFQIKTKSHVIGTIINPHP